MGCGASSAATPSDGTPLGNAPAALKYIRPSTPQPLSTEAAEKVQKERRTSETFIERTNSAGLKVPAGGLRKSLDMDGGASPAERLAEQLEESSTTDKSPSNGERSTPANRRASRISMSALEEDIDEEQTSILNALDAGADAFPPAPPPAAADGGDDAAEEEAAATRMQAAQRGKAARAEVAASKATGEAPATAEEEAPAAAAEEPAQD